jgi:hypothetical protein
MSIRWDAVVDRSGVDFGASLPPRPRSATDRDNKPIRARVRLFGAIAWSTSERTIALELQASETLGRVFARLGEHLGEHFLAQVLDEGGAKRRHCRLFVGGYAVEDLQTPLCSTVGPSEIDIILLIAPEGG